MRLDRFQLVFEPSHMSHNALQVLRVVKLLCFELLLQNAILLEASSAWADAALTALLSSSSSFPLAELAAAPPARG